MSARTNTIRDAGETGSQRISAPARPNPIAAEIPVNASGTRPKNGSAERELFSEDTETVLTFEDGAVIRLLAAVTPGQLVFLTNLATKQEVVCQVLRKRLLRPAGCYVELQFTEQKKGFWDAPPGVAAQSAAESGTKTAQKAPETADPSKKSIETLVTEVQELLGRKAAPEKKEPAAGVGSAESQTPQAGGASAGASLAAAEPTPVDQAEGRAARAEADDTLDDLLPKPELDFSQVPSAPPVKKPDPGLLQRPIPVVGAMTQKLTWALLLLALLGVGVRYGHWLDFLTRSEVAVVKPAGPAESMAPAQSPRDGAAKSGEGEKAAATRGTRATVAPATGGQPEKSEAVAEKAPSENTRSENAEPKGSMNEPQHPAAKALADPNGKSETSATVQAELPSTDTEPEGQEPLVAAKLLKSVNPVYPPDAMRSFITGDVKAEVEVGSDGRAGNVKVLSGPTQLRKAAVDALKQYEFSPAARGGKAVESKVIVTLKFWFNP